MKIQSSLLFIMISTSIFAQSWLDKTCPTLDKEVNIVEFEASKERNILEILISQSDELVINGEEKPNLNSEIKFKEFVLEFVTNPNKDRDKAENPNKVFIKLSSYNKISTKINKLDTYIKEVYLYLWDNEAQAKYESIYSDIPCKKREKVIRTIPLRIVSEATPKPNLKRSAPNRGIGLPPFGGDIKE